MTATESTTIEGRRARLRSDVALAARVLPTHYPLETFIAVNPLAGLENMPFDQAIRRAGDVYGTPGILRIKDFRKMHGAGRVTDADLDAALSRRYPNLAGAEPLRFGGRDLSPLELMRADLLHGVGCLEPVRRYRTRSEELAPQLADTVDAQTAKWCTAFFGAGAWPMPGRESGFYSAWRALAPRDPSLKRAVRARLRRTSERAEDAALTALEALGVGDDRRIAYLQAHLSRLPGWAAHIHWGSGKSVGIDLTDYAAMRLAYESALLAVDHSDRPADRPVATPPSARERADHIATVLGLVGVSDDELSVAARVLAAMPVTAREPLWQSAFESHYRGGLLRALDRAARDLHREHIHTQVVTCIDTRSEGLRRHLESLGGYQTLGFAGFFAAAIRFTDLMGGVASDLCPVLIAPSHEISELASADGTHQAERRMSGARRLAGAEAAFHTAKEAVAAPFTLAEAAGWAAAPLAAAKTLTPALSGAIRRHLHTLAVPEAATVLSVDAMPLAERVLFANVALATMGLVDGFGRLVVLCAHGSSSENNPYQAALDCGACGGQAGGPNARTAVAILNETEVRRELRGMAIDIPDQTWFVAAQHDTTRDRIQILDRHLIPATHQEDVARLDVDLAHAGAALAAERCATLPGARRVRTRARAARHVSTRSVDWAQVYPEWGLADNAAFIVGPRDMSAGLDLQRRTFLHSYDAEVDADGSALETIMTAPLVVAQWINCQYYFSAVAPDVFGAGTKTVHNVVGSAGVISGHNGDLRLGLPWQSIADGSRLRHEPMRLLAVIQAPLSRIDTIIDRNPILQRLFGNEWVSLAARPSAEAPWQQWTRTGWRPWFESYSLPTVLDEERVS
ncbi:membrane protein [Mycolicibacterium aromaticivorans JS19b1 = JCM 16368]|uniref:Probable inorganic carbon transporter subunit DabA n=1 Tax=Mycolicibacterium aromaticivorans JS19b1 = JCM 16368 TaxID=1440774 RepID=A0A064CQ01_9MYCO|nr:DUF2309 domain-containing protein [Mycolicibacterium aromaticivorans]KDF01747.1 membrane protein [Mycolicibacterium aromaticivorans JS19b1 = JCM 16368]